MCYDVKKPKSSTSCRSNETDFPADLFLLLERLFKLNYKTVVPLELLIAPLVITNPISYETLSLAAPSHRGFSGKAQGAVQDFKVRAKSTVSWENNTIA